HPGPGPAPHHHPRKACRWPSKVLVVRPLTSQLTYPDGSTTIDCGLHHSKYRALHGGGRQDGAPTVVARGGPGRLVLVGDELPHLLEDHTGDQTADDAGRQRHWLVDDLFHTCTSVISGPPTAYANQSVEPRGESGAPPGAAAW